MNARTYLQRGLSHYRSSLLGVVIGSALGAMVLLGAFIAGDSVTSTLRNIASSRIGQIDYLLPGGDRFFRDELANSLEKAAPILLLKGQATAQASSRGTGDVQILGVTDSFWSFAPEDTSISLGPREVAINSTLADSLDLFSGDTLIVRIPKPGLASRDAPLSGEPEELLVFRATIKTVLTSSQFGNFRLEPTQLPAPSIFLPLNRLQETIEQPGKSNLLLIDSEQPLSQVQAQVRDDMTLADYGLSLTDIPLAQATDLRSDRIFIDPPVQEALLGLYPDAQPIITYLANTISTEDNRETPYSMATAVNPIAAPFLPQNLSETEIVINQWLADDLSVQPGDSIALDYYRLEQGNQLVTEAADFTIAKVIPMEGLTADKKWMPDFPGLAEAENSADWESSLPLDLTRIRDKDETYWDDHKGTPKAFINLTAGLDLWANRWGHATALRIPQSTASPQEIETQLLSKLQPDTLGLGLLDLRQEALSSATSPTDIGQLFLSMSFFLIVAAITLVALLFRFNTELRNRETGLLSALGFRPKIIRNWQLLEAFAAVLLGSLLALPFAALWSYGILRFIETIWSSGQTRFSLHLDPASTSIRLLVYIVLVMASVWFAIRRQSKQALTLRLQAQTEETKLKPSRLAPFAALITLLLALTTLVFAKSIGPQGAFFLTGFLLLLTGLFTYRWFLAKTTAAPNAPAPSRLRASTDLAQLALLNTARRPSRSLAVTGILASGVFLVISVAAFRKQEVTNWQDPQSGTGGFALWIETPNPISRLGDGKKAADYLELGDQATQLGAILPFRAGEGNDASCFNLNTVALPRILATDTTQLAQRNAFPLKTPKGTDPSWALLTEGPTLRAFIEETTLLWVLKKQIGDTLTYHDEQGRPLEIEIAGTLPDTIFQGHLVIDETQFLKHWPSSSGYSLFLAETKGSPQEGLALIQKSLGDLGVTVQTTPERLAAFQKVENTYITIFNVLGGLGIILGATGLGLVTARNLAERRSELAIMHTLGLSQNQLRKLILHETRQHLHWGLAIGLMAALVSIIPVLTTTQPWLTLASILLLVIAITLTALLVSHLATRKALHQALTQRQEFS